MNRKESLSSWQMAALFLAFLTGSAIINIPAPMTGVAQNGAWISMLIAFAFGMLLLSCVLYLYRKYPEMTLIQYSRKAIGQGLTVLIAIPFFMTTLIMLANIVGDIGGFFKSVMMRETPGYMFHSLTFLTAAVTVRAGIEVMTRLFTIVVIIMYIFSVGVLLLSLQAYDIERLLPILPQGIKPVLHGVYFAWGFPNAELILFSMLLPFVGREKEKLHKRMFATLLVNGITLTIVIVCTIMALGQMAGMYKYSVFTLARLIEVREFIERIESIPGIALIAGSYMKATIVLFVTSLGISQLFRMDDYRILVFPVSLVSLLLSLTMFTDEVEFREFVTNVWSLLITLTGVLPILVLTVVTAVKSAAKRKAPNE